MAIGRQAAYHSYVHSKILSLQRAIFKALKWILTVLRNRIILLQLCLRVKILMRLRLLPYYVQ
jgi:hypothetical protein